MIIDEKSDNSIKNLPSHIIYSNANKIPKRVKQNKTVLSTSKIDESSSTLVNKAGMSNVNPLDQMCKLILEWKLDSITDMIERPPKIPLIFDSIENYIRIWEPLLVSDMKENILSNLSYSSFDKCKSGSIFLTQIPNNNKGCIVDCSFTLQETNIKSNFDK